MNFKIRPPSHALPILAKREKFSASAGSNLTAWTKLGTLKYPATFCSLPTPLARPSNASGARAAWPSKGRLQHGMGFLYERHVALPLAIRPTAEFLAMQVAIAHSANALDN